MPHLPTLILTLTINYSSTDLFQNKKNCHASDTQQSYCNGNIWKGLEAQAWHA